MRRAHARPSPAVWWASRTPRGRGAKVRRRSCREKPPSPGRRDRGGLSLGTAPLPGGATRRASWRLKPPSGRPSTSSGRPRRRGAWSKWFTRFLRETVGMMGTTKVLHLVERTFPRMARDAGSMRRCTMPALGSPEAVASGGATGEASGPRRGGGQDGEGRTRWPALRHSENSQRSVAIATGGHTAALLAPRPGRMLAVAHANGCHERVAVDSRARPDACRARRGQRSRRGRKRHQESTQGTSADRSSQGGEGLQHRLPHRLVMVRLTNTGPA
ncbi:hypothetical protein SAMN04487844_11365 [Methylobacterium sp. yr596]|nr:hypothetical protein SAMN04487844_11365 [Methylobacterium sp. yr596]